MFASYIYRLLIILVNFGMNQARPLLEEKVYMDLLDPAIKEEIPLLHLVLIVRVLESCLSYDPTERCSISKVGTYIKTTSLILLLRIVSLITLLIIISLFIT